MPWRPSKHLKSKTIGFQAAVMQEFFPQFRYKRIRNRPTWTGALKPTMKSPDYQVRIEYRMRYSPQVYVLSPEIAPNAPHIYHSDNCLCLYYPKDSSWSSEMLIAKTIVPWTSEWLRFYEIWFVTGKWFGVEAPHSGAK